MKRSRILVALVLTLALLAAMPAGAWGGTSGSNGVITPGLWTSGASYEWYDAVSVDTTRSAGQSPTGGYTFTLKANVARLHVENQGVPELDVAVNGQRLNLNAFFDEGQGAADFDISGLVHWGDNRITVRSLGTPEATATVKVQVPALSVRILHMNDIHAQIDPLPKAAAYIKAAKAAGGEVFFVNGGDNFSGNPVSDLNKGVPMVQIMNAMTTDLAALGNHDFDHGPDATQARRSESGFLWLSANTAVVNPSQTPIQPFEPYKVYTNELGQRVAFIGLTETPPSTGAKNTVGLAFTSPLAAAQRYVAELRDQVNLVVVVSHNGYDVDQAMAPELTGVDLIIGAHSHTYLSQPTVVSGVPIVQAGSGGAYIGDLVLRQADAVTLRGGAAGGAYTVQTSKLTVTDPDTQAIVDQWNADMGPILDTKIGYTPIELNRNDRYDQDVSIGNLITDAMRDYMGAEIGLTNNGGIRASIPAGDITMKDIYTVLPFGNFIQKFSLTGDQIRQVIEHSWNRDSRYQVDLQTSGLTYTTYKNPDGTFSQLDLKVNGVPLDPNRVYTVAVADYIGTGGGGYPIPSFATPDDISSDVDAIVVGEYVKKISNLSYKATEGRIKVVGVIPPTTVSKLNFYNASSLLAADATGTLTALTDQATVLVTSEATAYQYERSSTAPKNFPKLDAGTPIPLAAMQSVGNGKVVSIGALLVANGYRTAYQNAQWNTNLFDYLTGASSGTVLIDEGHGQYYDNTRYTQFQEFLATRGYTLSYTGKSIPLTAARLTGVDVLVISTPGSVGAYTTDEITVLHDFLAGGGNIILVSQTDYNNNSNPTELNSIAAGIGTVLRFNSDEVRDNTSKDGTANYSPTTTQINPDYPELLKVR